MSDVERVGEVVEPLISGEEKVGMVVFSTIVAVCGSYSFGTCAMWLAAMVCISGWVAIYWAWVPVYIGEITPSKLRGLLTSLNQLLIVIGLSATYVIGLIPCGILCIGLFFIPESPRWLVKSIT
nr:sugar transporter ERD6-like 8 [Ipomoea batatas]